MVFTLAYYIYNLSVLQKTNSIMAKWRHAKQETGYAWEVLGLSETSKTSGSLAMRTLFPFQLEMLFILALATCSKFADVRV